MCPLVHVVMKSHNRTPMFCSCNAPTHSIGGLDSLGAVEYINVIGRRLDMQLPSTLV
jgi:hypothetical protein